MGIKRTNYSRASSASDYAAKAVASWAEFLAANRLLVLFSMVFLAGSVLGVMIYALSGSIIGEELGTILEVRAIIGGFRDGVSALFSSIFSTILLLALLFLCGLSACGAPFATVVPLFFGMGLGLTEAYYSATGLHGFIASAILIVPHYLVAATALLFGSMESIRMSLLLSRQLLSDGGIGGLWQDFKMYCVRFLAYLIPGFASGIVDVLFRLIFGSFFQK
ncbi:MAG TPA: hypothetical protein DEB10_09025 [Ruminococcaceae bacterium]|nr:hypothetical protein [Oscillospiraceae bacterium]